MAGQGGMSLIELVIALSIGTFVILGAMRTLSFFQKSDLQMDQIVEVETDIRRLSSVLPVFLGQGVNVDWTSSSIGNIGTGRGKIRKYSSTFTNHPEAPVTLGVFLRETGRPTSSAPKGEIRATGVYFKRPSLKEPGELIVSSSTGEGGVVSLFASDEVFRFSSIVSLKISPGGLSVANGQAVRVVRVDLSLRRFWSGDKNDWRWCPVSELNSIEECKTKANFKDTEYSFQISLYNNSISTNFTTSSGVKKKESLFGSLYFFRPVTSGER